MKDARHAVEQAEVEAFQAVVGLSVVVGVALLAAGFGAGYIAGRLS